MRSEAEKWEITRLADCRIDRSRRMVFLDCRMEQPDGPGYIDTAIRAGPRPPFPLILSLTDEAFEEVVRETNYGNWSLPELEAEFLQDAP